MTGDPSDDTRQPSLVCTSSIAFNEAVWPLAPVSVTAEAVLPWMVTFAMLSVGLRTLVRATCIACSQVRPVAEMRLTSDGASTCLHSVL